MKKTSKTEDDLFFDKIQSVWDAHTQRVEAIVHNADGGIRQVDFRHAMRRSRRETWCHLLVALCMAVSAVWWACIMGRYATDTLMLVLCLVVEVSLVFFSVHSLARAIGRWRTRQRPAVLSRPHPTQSALYGVLFLLIMPPLAHAQAGDGLNVRQNHASVLNTQTRAEAQQTIDYVLNAK